MIFFNLHQANGAVGAGLHQSANRPVQIVHGPEGRGWLKNHQVTKLRLQLFFHKLGGVLHHRHMRRFVLGQFGRTEKRHRHSPLATDGGDLFTVGGENQVVD